MKFVISIFVLLACSSSIAEVKESSPVDVVNARMRAYNHHNLELFLAAYSEDIQVFTYPNIPIGKKGKKHLRSIFEPMFKAGKVSVQIIQQIPQGNYVVNHEVVDYAGKETKYVSIYEVKNGLITSVQFVREQ